MYSTHCVYIYRIGIAIIMKSTLKVHNPEGGVFFNARDLTISWGRTRGPVIDINIIIEAQR